LQLQADHSTALARNGPAKASETKESAKYLFQGTLPSRAVAVVAPTLAHLALQVNGRGLTRIWNVYDTLTLPFA